MSEQVSVETVRGLMEAEARRLREADEKTERALRRMRVATIVAGLYPHIPGTRREVVRAAVALDAEICAQTAPEEVQG
jgi:ferritin-like protein